MRHASRQSVCALLHDELTPFSAYDDVQYLYQRATPNDGRRHVA